MATAVASGFLTTARALLVVPAVTEHDDSLKPEAPSVASSRLLPNPHYAALGGATGVKQLVERFYVHMERLPEARAIRALHPADLEPVKRVLLRYLTEWLGGPADYSPESRHPRLRKRHRAFAVGPGERDAWMRCMRAALSEVVADAGLRSELEQSFYAVADFLRNDADHQHIRHHEER